jgi:dienelactone hydrolase
MAESYGRWWMLVALLPAICSPYLSADDSGWQTISVAQTYNHQPFAYRMKLASQRPGYKIYKLYYPSPVTTPVAQNNTIPAEYFIPDSAEGGTKREGNGPHPNPLPKGEGIRIKRPAVICLHILDGNEVLTDLFCSSFAMRGVPAIMFKLPYYGEREVPGGPMALAKDPQLFAGAIGQAAEDVRRTIDLLASRPEVDPQKVGIMGISLGGLVAASAAGLEPRLARAGFLLAGGDLPQIIGHSWETRPLRKTIDSLPADQRQALEKTIARLDPLQTAPGLRQRAAEGRVLMINAAEDEVIPRICTEKLAAALGMERKVAWLPELGHYTSMAELPLVLNLTADFFARDLPPGARGAMYGNGKGDSPIFSAKELRQNPALKIPTGRLADLCRQLDVFLIGNPEPGRCHILDLEFTASLPGQKSIAGRFRCIHGDDHRFVLALKLPFFGALSLGQGRFPWVVYGEKKAVQGTRHPLAERKDFLAFADRRQVALLKMLAGMLRSVAMVPEVLERLVMLTDEPAAGGVPAIRMTLRDPPGAGGFRLLFNADGQTPQRLEFEVRGTRGAVEFRDWRINAVARDDLFQPPAGGEIQTVDQAEVYQIFSALLKSAPAGR